MAATLHGPLSYTVVRAKQVEGFTVPMKAKMLKSGLWGFRGSFRDGTLKVGDVSRYAAAGVGKINCIFNGSTSDNFNENDHDYLNSTVVEAVEVKSGSEGFLIKMRDGKYINCIHNTPPGGYLVDFAPHPAIVLRMEDGSDLLFPIIVLELPSTLLMAALRNVQIVRPTMYQVMVEMVEKMGYAVKLVRITKRVHEAYIAQLYLSKVGNEAEIISFDLRPSDAINIAVRCKVPIQVHKYLAYSDGMRVIQSAKLAARVPFQDGLLFTELDRPDDKPCVEATEFDLVRNMIIAVVEERYKDAARWRDKLNQHRSKKHKWA